MSHYFIYSYSGGKDSTAMLHYCKEKLHYPIDEVIYVRDIFPYGYQLMLRYFKYIEKRFQIRIIRLRTSIMEYLEKWGKPKLPHPYCVHLKIETMVNYLKEKYESNNLTILIGTRKAESIKRANYHYSKYGMPYIFNEKFNVDYLMEYPIYEIEDTFQYLKDNDIKINPLYQKYNLERLSCRLCVKVRKKWEDLGL